MEGVTGIGGVFIRSPEILDAMLVQLRDRGVEVEERVEDSEQGRFGWARDPEGNRIELWQPAPGC